MLQLLREAILKGEFKPGERLVQEELANALKVSRMPVREALRKLEMEGLVIIEPHRGAIVKGFQIEDIVEIYRLRTELEKIAVELSVERMTESDIAQLESLVLAMEELEDVNQFVQANVEFHKSLIKHCPWNRLLSFIEILWNGFPQHTPQVIPGQMAMSKQEHKEIMAAVRERDAQKAAQLLAAHIKRTGEQLIEKVLEDRKMEEQGQERKLIGTEE